MKGWRKITCAKRDEIVFDRPSRLTVLASLTDLAGRFGRPEIHTEWAEPGTETPILRDYRWPDDPARRCEHWVPESEGQS